MTRTITQRELRNDSGEIMQALDRGEDFIVTRNGVPVGELRPVRRRFIDRDVLLRGFRSAAPVDAERFRAQERARRQDRLQRAEAALDPLPFDDGAARAYGRVYAASRQCARKPRGARTIDLLIASVALANDLPLLTRNPADFEHLEEIGLQVRAV